MVHSFLPFRTRSERQKTELYRETNIPGFMKELLNKLMMYHQIQQMSRNGWKVAKIASFLVLNRRTVRKYLLMTEDEFLEYQQSIGNRARELDLMRGL
jgi:hypothetical protein